MEIKNIYPEPTKRARFLLVLRRVAGYFFLAGALVCPIVNLAVGGKAWSVVVLWSIYTASCLLFTPLVEYNLISQGTKLMVNAAILQALIDHFLAPGWAYIVVPATISTALLVLSILLFSDLRRRSGNVMPLVLVLAASLVVSVIYLSFPNKAHIPMIVLGSVAAVLTVAVAVIMRGQLLLEIKKYFHIR